MIEIWKDVPGYEGLYQVSNYGRVLSLYRYRKKSQNILKTFTRKTGYIAVTLQKNGKRETKLVHQLVALCFIDNPNNYPIINHKDENPSNNRVDNLEWCTHKYNSNYGTGFFCLIPFPDKTIRLRTLMTNEHILQKSDI